MRRYLRQSVVPAALMLVLFAFGMLTGCYERVVGVEGVGTETMEVYEPNLKDPNDSVLPKRQTVPTKTVPTKQSHE